MKLCRGLVTARLFRSSVASASGSPPLCRRFQYVLNAATSIATKVNEETLTYLNQGQSYEIRIKKLGDLTSCSDAIFRVSAYGRRSQELSR